MSNSICKNCRGPWRAMVAVFVEEPNPVLLSTLIFSLCWRGFWEISSFTCFHHQLHAHFNNSSGPLFSCKDILIRLIDALTSRPSTSLHDFFCIRSTSHDSFCVQLSAHISTPPVSARGLAHKHKRLIYITNGYATSILHDMQRTSRYTSRTC